METYQAVLFDLFGTLVTDRGDAIEGAREILDRLPKEHWAIVTSCPAQLAQLLLARAQLPEPKVLVTSNDVARGKPAPDCYLLAADRLGVKPEACLVVEDSFHGIAAGRAAGMNVISVGEVALRDLALDFDPAREVIQGPDSP